MMEKETEISAENQESSELSDVKLKTKYSGTVIKTSLAGALVDIGLETPGVVHISQLQKEPVQFLHLRPDKYSSGDTPLQL